MVDWICNSGMVRVVLPYISILGEPFLVRTFYMLLRWAWNERGQHSKTLYDIMYTRPLNQDGLRRRG